MHTLVMKSFRISPDLLPASYYYHYSPIVDLTGPYTLARNTNENSTMWNCWRLRYMMIEKLFQRPWRGNFSPQSTCTETSTQSVYFFGAEETIDEYDGRKSH